MEEEKEKKERPDQNLKLKEVHKAWGLAEAEVIKTFLESNGILCYFRGKVVQSILPFTTDGLGEIKIFVSEKDYALARKLLKEKNNR